MIEKYKRQGCTFVAEVKVVDGERTIHIKSDIHISTSATTIINVKSSGVANRDMA